MPRPHALLTFLLTAPFALPGCSSDPHTTAAPPAQPAHTTPAAPATNASAAPAPGTLAYDKSVFGALLEDHAKIRREVHEINNGVEAVTESDDPVVAARLFDHVTAMKGRLETGRRVRQWDPLYIAMFDYGDKVTLNITRTAKGVRITETSDDPQVVLLIQEHARVVSAFAANGPEEASKEHPVPVGVPQP